MSFVPCLGVGGFAFSSFLAFAWRGTDIKKLRGSESTALIIIRVKARFKLFGEMYAAAKSTHQAIAPTLMYGVKRGIGRMDVTVLGLDGITTVWK